jgi:hypothetical protein
MVHCAVGGEAQVGKLLRRAAESRRAAASLTARAHHLTANADALAEAQRAQSDKRHGAAAASKRMSIAAAMSGAEMTLLRPEERRKDLAERQAILDWRAEAEQVIRACHTYRHCHNCC